MTDITGIDAPVLLGTITDVVVEVDGKRFNLGKGEMYKMPAKTSKLVGVLATTPAAYQLAEELAEAVEKDEAPEVGGFDLSAGMIGPNVSDWLRKLAAPTPRVDAVASAGWSGDAIAVPYAFAQKLERERDALKGVLADLYGQVEQARQAGIYSASPSMAEALQAAYLILK